MKIGFLYEPSISRGIRRYQEELFYHLTKIDNSIILIYENENGFTTKFKNKYKIKYLSFIKNSKFKKLIQKLILLPCELNRKFDIIIYPYQFSPIINPFGTKKITIVHDLIPLKYPTRFIYFLVYLFLVRLSLKTSDIIICVSDETKFDVVSIFKIVTEKIRVVYSGVSEKFRYYNKETGNYYLCFYREEPWKNYSRIINIFENYKLPYNLIVIGKESNPKNNIKFIGSVSDDKLIEMYNSAIGLLYFSNYEGFGFPLLESMRCGCPVITSTSKNMPMVTTEEALKVDIESDVDIINTLNNLVTNKNLRENVVMAGLIYSNKFTWAKCAEDIYQILRDRFTL